MPFFMIDDIEAVLLTDLDYWAPRVMMYREMEAKEFLKDALDQLDKAHDVALLHSSKYQQSLRWNHSRRVRGQAFNVGDLILRLVQSNKGCHKLIAPWEGPYIIAEVLRPSTYKLKDASGRVYTNAWNIEQLRRFYP
jgi:hypothetical protein